MPLESLYVEETKVIDISALEGMPLRELYLIDTQVSDISPLKDMPLVHLNLIGTKVTDLSVIETLSLKILWLRKTPVEDLSPLAGSTLPSLDIQDTPVSDISFAEEMPALVRLNMAGTKVTDLTPLKGCALTRLIFTPENITKGIEVIREMESLTQLDTSFDGDNPTAMSADEFWAKFDAGDFGKKSVKKPKNDD
jgi:internalin A